MLAKSNQTYPGVSFQSILVTLLLISYIGSACKKSVQIDPPVNMITTSQVFSTDAQANSAMAGIYSMMANSNNLNVGDGAITMFTGMSSDELLPFLTSTFDQYIQFQTNTLLPSSSRLYNNYWVPAYSYIYNANAVIEGLTSSTSVHDSVKTELIGEAKFIRSFFYFYLTSLFGDIPLATSTNWAKTNLLSRTPSDQVYQFILSDLQDALPLLSADFSKGGGERIFPTKWAVYSLLARTSLYMEHWQDAEDYATKVIENEALFSLPLDLDQVFLMNSSEAIWQLKQNNNYYPYNATLEGFNMLPFDASTPPLAYLTPQLLAAFDTVDQRRIKWINSTNYNGVDYYYPYKYKVGPSLTAAGDPYTEYYMVLRLGELYLIRAEARAQQGNDLQGAAADLNAIRNRAGLLGTDATSKDQLLAAIAHERQIELFAEWGHRWLDLKRTNQASIVLAPVKPQWNNHALLYPIPIQEIMTDPNLTQNPGYN
ncbi:MAG TPA: RagB/SusD family nutrient uptake outer membrane protein [Puia sp.]|nr:RagB/SusD family nutrient uptake outer membrane protein [Puia sp.]